MASNILIFGAGASYGSDTSDTPPTSDKLIDELPLFDPYGWGKLPDQLKNGFRKDFELSMSKLADTDPYSLPRLQRAMASYFYKFVPQDTNLYISLAHKIVASSWNGAFATLNYERLLELSLLSSGLNPYCIENPGFANGIEICLPHGCCHLFCDSVIARSDGVSISGQNITTQGKISVVFNPDEFHQRINSDAFPPVMSYFTPDKDTTSGINFIENQRNRYNNMVMEAKKVGIVGLHIRPNDTHIWKPISETNASLLYCSGKSSVKEFYDWTQSSRSDKENIILEEYFSDGFDQICDFLEIT